MPLRLLIRLFAHVILPTVESWVQQPHESFFIVTQPGFSCGSYGREGEEGCFFFESSRSYEKTAIRRCFGNERQGSKEYIVMQVAKVSVVICFWNFSHGEEGRRRWYCGRYR